MDKFIVTAWKNSDMNVRESVAYDPATAEDVKQMFNNFGYNAVVTYENIPDVKDTFNKEYEGVAA